MDNTDLPVKFDPHHADSIQRRSWQLSTAGYARCHYRDFGQVRYLAMHRLVWALEHGWENVPTYIDHINGDRLDNRLVNLRPTTLSLNAHNARPSKRRVNDLPQGVALSPKSSVHRYAASISHATRVHHLGVFATVEEAKAVYDEAKRRIMDYEVAVSLGKTPEALVLPVTRRQKGRPPRLGAEEAARLYAGGMGMGKIGKALGCCSITVRRLLRVSGVYVRRGRIPVDGSPTSDILNARISHLQEKTDDYGDNHRECGQGTRTPDVEVRQADGELLGCQHGEERRGDDVD